MSEQPHAADQIFELRRRGPGGALVGVRASEVRYLSNTEGLVIVPTSPGAPVPWDRLSVECDEAYLALLNAVRKLRSMPFPMRVDLLHDAIFDCVLALGVGLQRTRAEAQRSFECLSEDHRALAKRVAALETVLLEISHPSHPGRDVPPATPEPDRTGVAPCPRCHARRPVGPGAPTNCPTCGWPQYEVRRG